MQDYASAFHHIAALTQCDPNTCVVDVRAIHDSNQGVAAIPFRGTLPELWNTLIAWNNAGYGLFVTMADMDGAGLHTENVRASRVQAVDLDNISAQQNYERAIAWTPTPSFATNTSIIYRDDGQIAYHKYHVCWSVPYYKDNDLFSLRQRKLRQMFDGDKTIIDAPRVLRLAGTLHMKNPARPHLVTFWSLGGGIVPHETIDAALAHVNVIDTSGTRQPLGAPDLAAPSLEWVKHALTLLDPNQLDRGAWMGITYAVKQSGWSLTDPDTLFGIWSEWCAQYGENDPAENLKQWNSIRDTELGWQSLKNRIPSLKADIHLGGKAIAAPVPDVSSDGTPPIPQPPALDCSGEILTDYEQREYFSGCISVISINKIMTPKGEFLSSGQFNQAYGGKQFIYTSTGKTTDEPWKAATRSSLWTIPKVSHTRFLPQEPTGTIITDVLGRTGVNIYIPPNIYSVAGDASPFLNHIARIIPAESDRRILFEWMAHIVKYPGFKIPWAPVIQSAEGVGKGLIKELMTYAVGLPYVHFPNAQELADSGGKFNAWMRHRIFILADEINVGDKLHMVEVLKPLISEKLIEVQGKGQDQQMEDNSANWGFFTNYKTAVPTNKNGRRYSVFFSPFQTEADLLAAGMNEAYFNAMFRWLHDGGAAFMTHWLMNYPIERGAIPMRAPKTTSTAEAQRLSRSPIERAVAEAIEDGVAGFRGGFLSSISIAKRIKETGAVRGGNVSPSTIETVAAALGYVALGRAPKAYFAEAPGERTYLFALDAAADVSTFGRLQGWE